MPNTRSKAPSKTRKAKQPGKPRKTATADDNASVRDRLLEVATRLFAEQGYDGTSVDAIVDGAGVNKNMVYYYFGSKSKLYMTVFDEAYLQLQKLELLILEDNLPIEKLIPKLVRLYFELHGKHEALTRLVLWENLARGRHLIPKEIKAVRLRVYEIIREALESGKREGTVSEEIDDKYFMITLIGACQIYASNRYTLSHSLNINLRSESVLKEAEAQVIKLLVKSIRK
jgi:AcrR family transcriptional regulator